jgi:hypothetical protein
LMSTVEVMICNDEVHQLILSLMSTGISVSKRCQLCGEIDNTSSEVKKYFMFIVDHDRIKNIGLANEDQSSIGRSALHMYRRVP